MFRLRLVLGLACLALLAACELTYTDVSDNPHLSHLVGTRYQVVGALDMYGISKDYDGKLASLSLSPTPMDGPEFVSRREVPRGRVLTVEKVFKTNRWPESNRVFQVRLEDARVPAGLFTEVELLRGNESRTPWKLNPLIYRELPRE